MVVSVNNAVTCLFSKGFVIRKAFNKVLIRDRDINRDQKVVEGLGDNP